MSTLPDELFSLVEKSILAAREAAEKAAQAALNTLAVNRPAPYDSMNEGARQLRRALRAKARQLGGGSQTQGLQPLVEEIAYQQWHRMLFARFLAENDLLMHPTGVPVTLQDCAELAPEEGEADAWAVAAKYASEMLPGIFRRDDPVVQLRFAPEGRLELERILGKMPPIVFQADDSLGWMYQFWQSKKKAEVNASERKIGGADLAPVTQLFTEDYMVRFLLENSLGAWWAARHPDSPLIREWEYLRFKDDGEPAAGTFPGWPENIAEVTVMDPCCGSGHFLVAAFEMLFKMRIEAEGLGIAEAVDSVIRDNLFGLEIDPRCTQIAAFALALAAWKGGGYRELPVPNIACSGIPVRGGLDSWQKLAENDDQLRYALKRIYYLFENATTLGSLISPSVLPEYERMFTADYDKVAPFLEEALSKEDNNDLTISVFGNAVIGLTKAAKFLVGKYTLVATNVPYLGQKKQDNTLKDFCESMYPKGKADLATVFLERCIQMSKKGGSYAIVTPQNWLFQKSSDELRIWLLKYQTWHLISRLGPGAFRTIGGEVVKAILGIFSNRLPPVSSMLFGIDVSKQQPAQTKAASIQTGNFTQIGQKKQLENPSSRVVLKDIGVTSYLSKYVLSSSGMLTGDRQRFYRRFWEVKSVDQNWEYSETSVSETVDYGGRTDIVFYQQAKGELFELAQSLKHLNHAVQNWQRGQDLWCKNGVAIKMTGKLAATIYTGNIFDNTNVVICPISKNNLKAVWAFCSSLDFDKTVRLFNQKLSVDPSYLINIPFDLEHWQRVAEEQYPNELPEPYSNDLTQWLFDGIPIGSTDPLHVAVSRLLGYRWPEQKSDSLETYVDDDGIVCLTPVIDEAPAADHLRALLQVAYGETWSAKKQAELLAEVGFTGKTLRTWLRDGFFKQHVKLFKNRPFIWHIWDGRRDGFHALVNYHKLDAVTLERLIYTYLGDWIRLQRDKRDLGEPGADGRLIAAIELQEKLEAIREGEPPYDIYVRWKSLAEQPIGWNPDLNDGVRLNIRPFVTAGVLRRKFTVHWRKDRGKNPDGSERHNDLHYTIAEKHAARQNL